jgi:hypothetical protein
MNFSSICKCLFFIIPLFFFGCSPLSPVQNSVVFNKYSLYDGGSYNTVGNGDDIANKSETLRMNVEIAAFGGANGVTLALSSQDPYITINPNSRTASIGDIDTSYPYKSIGDYSGSTESSIGSASSSSCFLFSISSTCPAGHSAPFILSITAGSSVYSDTFNVPIQAISADIQFSAYSLYDGGSYNTVGNGDNIANKNETLRMNVELRNSGTSDATSITAVLSTSDQYVTINQSYKSATYGTMSSDYPYKSIGDYSGSTVSSINSASSSSCFLFSVSGTCPANHSIPFSLLITDDKGNTWTRTFSVPVSQISATIQYNAYSLYDGGSYNTVGNGDNISNKGETIRMNVELLNAGTSDATGITATLTTTDSYITVNSSYKTATFGTITSDYPYFSIGDYSGSTVSSVGSASSSSCYLFSVNSTCPSNHQVLFNLAIADNKGNTWSDTFYVTVQQIAVSFSYSANAIYDGGSYNTVGNSNNLLNKGESARLNVEIKNTGTSDAKNITGTLSTSDPYVTVNSTYRTATYGNIGSDYPYFSIGDYSGSTYTSVGSAASSSCFLITVSSSCPSNRSVPFTLSLVDDKSNTWSVTFNITVY